MLGMNRKKEEEEKAKAEAEKLSQAMRQMSEQIGSLQQQLNARTTEVETLKKQVGERDARITQLQRSSTQSAAADAADDKKLQAAEQKVKQLEAEVAKLKTAPAATAKPAVATGAGRLGGGAAAKAEPSGGVEVGAAAWVRKAGGKGLNRRTAPGTSSQVLDSFTPGTLLAVLEGPRPADNYTWWKVVSGDNREGWVAGEELVSKPE